MRASLKKFGIIIATTLVIAGTSITLPTSAEARWGGHHHGGWGWGGFGIGLGTGLLVGAATAPYYGGYGYASYDGPYDYGYYPDYAYGYEYAPTYAYYDEPYDYGYSGGGAYVSYSYSNYRRPHYRTGRHYVRSHSNVGVSRTYSRTSGSYARANVREGVSYTQSRPIRSSTKLHRVREYQR
jgi:hypothetical protein